MTKTLSYTVSHAPHGSPVKKVLSVPQTGKVTPQDPVETMTQGIKLCAPPRGVSTAPHSLTTSRVPGHPTKSHTRGAVKGTHPPSRL